MTMTSFVAVVALHTARIVKNGLSVFETLGFKIIKSVSVFEREEICYKIHYTLYLSQQSEIVLQLEFSQTKTDFSEKGLALKG